MKKLILLTVTLLMRVGLFAQNQNDMILGEWENKEKTHIVEFVKNGNTYEAIIRKSKNSSVIGKKTNCRIKTIKQRRLCRWRIVFISKKHICKV
ncbi:MAG: hypothetical protein QM751_14655 [Paludibacteraceae bacterium]